MADPIEISSSDEAGPPRDTRKSLGKGHPSSASLRAAMSSSSEPPIRGKRAAPKNPRSASSSAASSSSAAPPAVKKRKRDPSYDSDVDEKKPKPKGASRRKLTPFEPWEDAVFIESVLAQYSSDHLVSTSNIVGVSNFERADSAREGPSFAAPGHLQQDQQATPWERAAFEGRGEAGGYAGASASSV